MMCKVSSMLKFQSQPQSPQAPRSTKTSIMIIGGAEDKIHGREILQTFFNRSGAKEAKLGIIPSASREPLLVGDRYRSIFSDMGAKDIMVFDIRDRESASASQWQTFLEECTGVFMTGGDQLRLCGLLADTPVMETVRQKALAGEITLAGTSAGAAVMGEYMIAGGGSGESPNRSLVDVTTGLAIVPQLLVDQHFHNRNRMARLISAISAYSDRIGIGIDEDTCVIVEGDGLLSVIGKGTVTIVDPGNLLFNNEHTVGATDPLSVCNLKVHILCHGGRYNMHSREIIIDPGQTGNLQISS